MCEIKRGNMNDWRLCFSILEKSGIGCSSDKHQKYYNDSEEWIVATKQAEFIQSKL